MKETIKNNLVTVMALGGMILFAFGGLVLMGVIGVVTAITQSCPIT